MYVIILESKTERFRTLTLVLTNNTAASNFIKHCINDQQPHGHVHIFNVGIRAPMCFNTNTIRKRIYQFILQQCDPHETMISMVFLNTLLIVGNSKKPTIKRGLSCVQVRSM